MCPVTEGRRAHLSHSHPLHRTQGQQRFVTQPIIPLLPGRVGKRSLSFPVLSLFHMFFAAPLRFFINTVSSPTNLPLHCLPSSAVSTSSASSHSSVLHTGGCHFHLFHHSDLSCPPPFSSIIYFMLSLILVFSASCCTTFTA